MLSQISSLVFGFNVRIFDDKIETKSLVRCDDDLLIHTIRRKQSQIGKGVTSLSRSAVRLFSFVLPWCMCTLKISFDLDSSSSFHYSDG